MRDAVIRDVSSSPRSFPRIVSDYLTFDRLHCGHAGELSDGGRIFKVISTRRLDLPCGPVKARQINRDCRGQQHFRHTLEMSEDDILVSRGLVLPKR